MPEAIVKVGRDHLERLAGASPIEGIAELIWNALDADAKEIQVNFTQNDLLAVETVSVKDDGEGIQHGNAVTAFGNLGESLKAGRFHTNGHRRIHGKRAQGRFRAFSIGDHIEWKTKFQQKGAIGEYVIVGDRSRLEKFNIDDDVEPSASKSTGTEVTISRIPLAAETFRGERARLRLTEEFALYLRQYPDVSIVYDGFRLDSTKIEKDYKEYKLDSLMVEDGRAISPSLTIIEWSIHTEHHLHICDAHGFSLLRRVSEVRTPGFDFTAYLKSDFFRDLADKNALHEMNVDLVNFIEKAKDKVRRHFKAKESARAASVIREWKEQKIYPYSTAPKTEIEKNERKVFDVVALNVNSYLSGFDRSDQQNKSLTLQLIKAAIEQGPKALRKILQDVLSLPRDKQEEFARLLDQASLTAIINASRTIADRLDFLRALAGC